MIRTCSAVIAASLFVSAPARAESPSSVPGLVVIVTSIAAGAALTGYGLTIDCRDDGHACHRRASLPIWGGVAVAATGSLVGLQLLPAGTGSSSSALLSLGGRF